MTRYTKTGAYWHWCTSSAAGLWPRWKLVLASPGYQVVLFHCFINESPKIPLVSWICRRLYSHLRFKYGIDLPLSAAVGRRLRIFHFGGIVINPSAIIGDDVTIMHGVTIGNDMVSDQCPVISNQCFLGAGCKVIGNVFLAEGTKVGANAVVVNSCYERGQTLVGIPARPLQKGRDQP